MSNTIRRCWHSLTCDRTRCSIAIAFVAVGLLFWARLIVIQDMPRTAVAEPETTAAPAPQPDSPESDDPDVDASDDDPQSTSE